MNVGLNLLLNLLLIILITSIQQFWIESRPRNRFESKWLILLSAAFIILFSMAFSTHEVDGLQFDLRRVPLWFGTLYGGPFVGLALASETVLIKLLYGTPGLDGTVISTFALLLATMVIRNYYFKWTLFVKMAVGAGINVIFSIVVIQLYGVGDYNPWQLSIGYILTNVTGILFVGLSMALLSKNYKYRMKLHQDAKQEIISHLAASVNDQVKNPLATIRGLLQLLESDPSSTPEKRSEFYKLAIEEIDRIDEVITDYSIFANPYYDGLQVLNTRTLIAEAREEIQSLADQAGIHVDDMNVGSCYFLGEGKQMKQVVVNLMKNSIEAMDREGILHLSAEYSKRQCIIRVKDNGSGMDEETLDRLGEPYFSTTQAGSGLGMMIVFKVVESLDGRIDITSKVREGTEVTLSFPAVKQPHIHQ